MSSGSVKFTQEMHCFFSDVIFVSNMYDIKNIYNRTNEETEEDPRGPVPPPIYYH